jgi:hypothetical protein
LYENISISPSFHRCCPSRVFSFNQRGCEPSVSRLFSTPKLSSISKRALALLIFIPDEVVANEYDQRSGQTIQFAGPRGNNQFQVSAWPYQDLDVALGDEAPAGKSFDQPDTLGVVRVFHDDMFEITFVKNGISYLVQTLPDNTASTLDILKSWEFI